MSDKVVVTCALTGVLTNPQQHPVPVTPEDMAHSAREAFAAGATVMHCHFRDQRLGMGHLPTWNVGIAVETVEAIRDACPDVIINMSTGVMGNDISGPLACMAAVEPEIAALNAGSLNYLKVRSNGEWAWPPLLFDNSVEKIDLFLEAMNHLGVVPECECFDTGILRSIKLFQQVGMLKEPAHVSLVMGVDSGMPARSEWLPLLLKEGPESMSWQAITIGRQEVWSVQRRAAELGGHLRTGLEDTFYLPDGSKAVCNGELVDALVSMTREIGREVASPDEARVLLGTGRYA